MTKGTIAAIRAVDNEALLNDLENELGSSVSSDYEQEKIAEERKRREKSAEHLQSSVVKNLENVISLLEKNCKEFLDRTNAEHSIREKQNEAKIAAQQEQVDHAMAVVKQCNQTIAMIQEQINADSEDTKQKLLDGVEKFNKMISAQKRALKEITKD